jgi:hypothetical protein
MTNIGGERTQSRAPEQTANLYRIDIQLMVENPATDSTPANSVTDVEREIICIWVRDSSKALAELQQSFEIARPDDTSPLIARFVYNTVHPGDIGFGDIVEAKVRTKFG